MLKGYFGPARTEFFRQVERTLARASDVLVAVSPEVRDDLVELGVAPREKFAVVRLGIPLAERLGDPTADLDFRALYGIPREAFVVGWVGRMTGVKDTGAVLEIVRATRDLGVDVVLCMVGDGPDREALVVRHLGAAIPHPRRLAEQTCRDDREDVVACGNALRGARELAYATRLP